MWIGSEPGRACTDLSGANCGSRPKRTFSEPDKAMEDELLGAVPSVCHTVHTKRTCAPDPEALTTGTLSSSGEVYAKGVVCSSDASAALDGGSSTTEASTTSSTMPLERLLLEEERKVRDYQQSSRSLRQSVPPAMLRLAIKYSAEVLQHVEELKSCSRRVIEAEGTPILASFPVDQESISSIPGELARFGSGCVVAGASSQETAFWTLAQAFAAEARCADVGHVKTLMEQCMICLPGGIVLERNIKMKRMIGDVLHSELSHLSPGVELAAEECRCFEVLCSALQNPSHQVFLFDVLDPALVSETQSNPRETNSSRMVAFGSWKEAKALFIDIQRRIDICLDLIMHALDTKASSLVRKSSVVDSIISRADRLKKRLEQRRDRNEKSRKRKPESEPLSPQLQQDVGVGLDQSSCNEMKADEAESENGIKEVSPCLRSAKRRGKNRSHRAESQIGNEDGKQSAKTLFRFMRRRSEMENTMSIAPMKTVTFCGPLALQFDSPLREKAPLDARNVPSTAEEDTIWGPDCARAPRRRLSLAMDVLVAASRARQQDRTVTPAHQQPDIAVLVRELRLARKSYFVQVFLQRWSRGVICKEAITRFSNSEDVELVERGIQHIRADGDGGVLSKALLNQVWVALHRKQITAYSCISGRFVRPGYRYLHFYENSRPPYHGPWPLMEQVHKIRPRAPFAILDDDLIDYDCDSDMEWEDDDSGEDLLSTSDEESAHGSSSCSGSSLECDTDTDFIADDDASSDSESCHSSVSRRGSSNVVPQTEMDSGNPSFSHQESDARTAELRKLRKPFERRSRVVHLSADPDKVLQRFKVILSSAAPTDLSIEVPGASMTPAPSSQTPTKVTSPKHSAHEKLSEKRPCPREHETHNTNIWAAFQKVICRRVRPFHDASSHSPALKQHDDGSLMETCGLDQSESEKADLTKRDSGS